MDPISIYMRKYRGNEILLLKFLCFYIKLVFNIITDIIVWNAFSTFMMRSQETSSSSFQQIVDSHKTVFFLYKLMQAIKNKIQHNFKMLRCWNLGNPFQAFVFGFWSSPVHFWESGWNFYWSGFFDPSPLSRSFL